MSDKTKNEKLAAAILEKLGPKGIEYFLKHGEMPEVKLTTEELKALKGGLKLKDFIKSFWPTYRPN